MHNRDPTLFQTYAAEKNIKSPITSNYQKCSKKVLRQCFTTEKTNFNQSCLYTKFLAPKQKQERSGQVGFDAPKPNDNLNEDSLLYHRANLEQENLKEQLNSDK